MKHLKETILCICVCMLFGCEKKTPTVLELFSDSIPLSVKEEWHIEADSIAVIDDLNCDGKNLIVAGYLTDNSYTLFDAQSGKYVARFGAIGQGPLEIPKGRHNSLAHGYCTAHSNETNVIIKYDLDSLRNQSRDFSVRLAKYDIPDSYLSRLIVVNDSTYIGFGTYKSRYQYTLFNKRNQVLDYGVELYNAADSIWVTHTRDIANQGDFVMNPKDTKFASCINFSSNIDFLEIDNNKIKLKKSLRLGDPMIKPFIGGGGTIFSIEFAENTQIGYINLSATSQYVYALYSDEKVTNSRKSKIVLVYDWEGTPIQKYTLDTDAYYIAVDEVHQNLLAAIRNEDGGWDVRCYDLSVL